jgi:hypothetical protein
LCDERACFLKNFEEVWKPTREWRNAVHRSLEGKQQILLEEDSKSPLLLLSLRTSPFFKTSFATTTRTFAVGGGGGCGGNCGLDLSLAGIMLSESGTADDGDAAADGGASSSSVVMACAAAGKKRRTIFLFSIYISFLPEVALHNSGLLLLRSMSGAAAFPLRT